MSIANEITRINTNIAAAYSACGDKGATMPLDENSANLADTISSIPTGSIDNTDASVKFYDVDGTVLHVYTREEALMMESMPDLPMHEGLDSIAWSWSLQEVQSLLAERDCHIAIGCYYKTSDNKTKVRIFLDASNTYTIYMTQSAAGQAQIDWGDGSAAETVVQVVGTGNNKTLYSASHTYTPAEYPAEYTIDITKIGGGWYGFGVSNYNSFSICRGDPNIGQLIRSVQLAEDAVVDGAAFYNAAGMQTITLTSTQAVSSKRKYYGCSSLLFSIARTDIQEECYFGCVSLKAVSLGKQISQIGNRSFYGCCELVSVGTLSNVSSIGDSAFYYCYQLRTDGMMLNCVTLSQNAFYCCFNIKKLVFSPSLTSIMREALWTNGVGSSTRSSSLSEVDLTAFTDPDTLPVLSASFNSSFSQETRSGSKIKIYVANQEMKTAFSNATNWSGGADYYLVREAHV